MNSPDTPLDNAVPAFTFANYEQREFTAVLPGVEHATDNLGIHPDPEMTGAEPEIVNIRDGYRYVTEDSVITYEWVDVSSLPEQLAVHGLQQATVEITRFTNATTITPVAGGPTSLEMTEQHGILVFDTSVEPPREHVNLISPAVTIEFEPDNADVIKEIRFADAERPSADRLAELHGEQEQRLFWIGVTAVARIKQGVLAFPDKA